MARMLLPRRMDGSGVGPYPGSGEEPASRKATGNPTARPVPTEETQAHW